MDQEERLHRVIFISLALIMFIFLFYNSVYNFLLFHTSAELFSICIAFSVFTITLSSLKYLKNNYYLIVGTAYLFIGIIDLFHTMSFKGMQIFTDYDYYANQLWIAARYMESITLLLALLLTKSTKRVNISYLVLTYSVLTVLILLSVFFWKNFPICFIEGVGLTPFKKVSEYIIILILGISLYLLYTNRAGFEKKIFYLIALSIVFTMLSELSFTNYISNFGFVNALGHYFKIFSFYLIYAIIIKTGIQDPYDLVFREMKLSETELSLRNDQLKALSVRDSLTTLYNHGYLYEFLEEEKKRYSRSHSAFSIVMIDIDHFKKINDLHGHIHGDIILKELAALLKEHLRTSDIVGRYGGEEFLAVLIDSDRNDAYQVAEKIRKTVENHLFSNGLSITLSIGVSTYKEGSISALIERADKKMYEAKSNGRNQTQQ